MILHIDCISVFIVYCFLFVCFFLYHSLMNKVAHHIATGQVPGEGKCSPFADPTTAHLSSVVKLVTTIKRRAFFFSGKRFATEKKSGKTHRRASLCGS